jgi:hypothetical protein
MLDRDSHARPDMESVATTLKKCALRELYGN